VGPRAGLGVVKKNKYILHLPRFEPAPSGPYWVSRDGPPKFSRTGLIKTDAILLCHSQDGNSLSVHGVVCVMRGAQPLPKRVLHKVRSRVSSVNLQYPLLP